MIKLYFFTILSFVSTQVFANYPPYDAVATSLGGSSVTYISPFSIEFNPANLCYTSSKISINAQNRYGIRQYSKVLLIGNYRLDKSAIAISYQAENGIVLNQKLALAFAKKFNQNLAAGITINFNRFSSQDPYYKNNNVLAFNIGLRYQINTKNSIGFQIENPNQSQIIEYPKENLPARIRLGINHELSKNINTYIDALQSNNQQINLCVGLEIIKEHYKFRTGFNLNQIIGCGISFKKASFLIDVGLSFHNHLSISPSLNTSYAW